MTFSIEFRYAYILTERVNGTQRPAFCYSHIHVYHGDTVTLTIRALMGEQLSIGFKLV